MVWDRNGVWIQTLDDQHVKQGGVWVIGDSPFDASSDYPGANDGSLLVKYWFAHPDKYGGTGYQPKDRIHENRWEYVKAGEGILWCRVVIGDDEWWYPTCCDADGVDLSPDLKRSWHLPANRRYASGITVCREIAQRLPFPGSGPGYELTAWKCGQDRLFVSSLVEPNTLRDWRYLYVLTAEGKVCFQRGGEYYEARPGQIVFLDRSKETNWHLQPAAGHGFAIFF